MNIYLSKREKTERTYKFLECSVSMAKEYIGRVNVTIFVLFWISAVFMAKS